MSLINKMLQDLDARGTPKDGELPGQVKPVAREPYRPNRRVIAAAVGGALIACALGWLALTQLHRVPHPVAPAPVVAVKAAPVVSGPVRAPQAPATVSGPVPATAPVPVPAAASAPGEPPLAAPAAAAEPGPKPMSRAERRAERARLAAERKAAKVAKAAGAAPAGTRSVVRAQDVAPMEPDSAEARAARRAMAQALAARGKSVKKTSAAMLAAARAAARDDTVAKGKHGVQGREETGAQRAEGEYRRALASLQEGRMGETVAALERALKYEPTHEAARQTLVGLLIEANRTDEAMRQLQLGLTLDARQPAMAMLLARLQIERGGSGIDTLMRTLPYAGNDPDYHAFLAAALARQQRHREAAEQYQQAVRAMPSNGVWWMGLGMSLQAEKRNGEALYAYQKARASGGMSEELQGFVERRIQQLGR
ncbi:tetratricopeptide repeat protein [Massilia luteola]|uniref:tetratricopeptide repeat protein n=1 Tax=Massilia luteola TaxID=3081751 RepID=UPI002ACC2263|nr:tetratricopeptide repeat protein [Massilia sp. Gc5]